MNVFRILQLFQKIPPMKGPSYLFLNLKFFVFFFTSSPAHHTLKYSELLKKKRTAEDPEASNGETSNKRSRKREGMKDDEDPSEVRNPLMKGKVIQHSGLHTCPPSRSC